VPPHSAEADVVPAVREAVGELTRVDAREKAERYRGSWGLLNPLGFLRTSIPYIWCILSVFPNLLTPLAEGTSFSQAIQYLILYHITVVFHVVS
jgi:hypothetical protein